MKENGQNLRIHTNKSKGSWAHLKHKMKRLYGTNNNLIASYVAEAVFRQNCRAKNGTFLRNCSIRCPKSALNLLSVTCT
jgi:hypothetical protein